MTAAPLPDPVPAPKTAADLGHKIHYPLFVDDVWRSVCSCHWWWPVEAPKDAK
jgi:hypothetical protein